MQKRSEETRTRILAVAMHLFAHNGFDATGVADICHAANVSKGAFYHHFATKQTVFLELLQEWLKRLDQEMARARLETSNVAAALERMSGMMRQVFEEASGNLPMFLEFWVQSSHAPAVWQIVIEPYRRYQTYFTKMIQQGIQEGSLQPIEPELAARMLVSLAIGILLQGVLDPTGANWERFTQQSMHMLIESWRNTS
jgi:AcrR family transcriptional regulator